MHLETRANNPPGHTGPPVSPRLLVIFDTEEESRLIDEFLGDCGAKPIVLTGYVALSDGYDEHYIALWNPALNPASTVPEAY